MSYLQFCINETLRIDPSVSNSSGVVLTENLQLGKYKILANSVMLINMRFLHHDKKQWREPERFIPERFDPKSEYFLTPAGTKRHPMSYGPFLGGKRICLGKTFAENIGKCILPIIISQLDMAFVNKDLYIRKPGTSIFTEDPPNFVTLKLHH